MHFVTFRAMIVAKLLRVDGQVTVATSDPLTCSREKHKMVMQTVGHRIACMFRKSGVVVAKAAYLQKAEARKAAIQQLLSWVKDDQVISAHEP